MRLKLLLLSLNAASLSVLSQSNKCIDDHNTGVRAYNQQNYSTAMTYYRKAADHCGMNESYNAIGRMYYDGYGVSQDYCEAMKWFDKASRLDEKSNFAVQMIKANGDPCEKKSSETVRFYEMSSTNTSRKTNQTVQLERGTYVGETINGKPDGKGLLTLKDGGTISGEFKNGLEHGRCQSCVSDGCLSTNYIDGKIADGAYWISIKDANLILEKGYIKNGMKDGEVRFFNPKPPSNADLLRIEIWEKGQFVRYKEGYDLYGNLIFRNGTGKIIEVYMNGQVFVEKKYVNNCKSGNEIYYHDNGKKMLEILWKCTEDGSGESLLWEAIGRFDEKGNPLPRGTLKNGNGTLLFLDETNIKTIEHTYKNGKLISERVLK